jgi:hypothetical protein
MTIEGEKVPAFSAISLNLPVSPHDNSSRIIDYSRELYSKNKHEVSKDIGDKYLVSNNENKPNNNLSNKIQSTIKDITKTPDSMKPKRKRHRHRNSAVLNNAHSTSNNFGKVAMNGLTNLAEDEIVRLKK